MPPSQQHTLARPAVIEGVGIHTGERVSLILHPAAAHAGIGFRRTDVTDRDGFIPARGEAVCATQLGTVIGNADGVSVSTIEHLMAVLNALSIDNVLIELHGPEVPIMDGSCEPFCVAVERAGRRRQAAARRYIEILEPIMVQDGDKRACLRPAASFKVAFEILFDDPAIGAQKVDLVVDEHSFRRELADSRTFGFLEDVERLHAAGLARGGSFDNVVVIDKGAVLNPGGLRRPDECVRHKALDAIGDLYLLGAPLLGRYEGVYAGHALNNALVREVARQPQAWRYAETPLSFAQAG